MLTICVTARSCSPSAGTSSPRHSKEKNSEGEAAGGKCGDKGVSRVEGICMEDLKNGFRNAVEVSLSYMGIQVLALRSPSK